MKDSSHPGFATIEQLQHLLARKKLSPVELTKLYLTRIEKFDGKLNAFRAVMAERALEEARAAERELFHGRRRGPLHGIPIALKDNIEMRGVRTTAGSAVLRDFVPAEDATVVRRLRKAGAVMIGKTNLHEFAYGVTCENPHYGAIHNPWDLTRISGGSSGGSAVAVAAGLCAAAIGTDTGGSVRIPAALCGVVGLKPTFGRVSVHGTIPLAASFDHVGPIARGVSDAAALLAVMAGRDARDPTSASRNGDKTRLPIRPRMKRLKLGRPKEYFWTQLDPEVRRLTEAALAWMAGQGALIKEIALPLMESSREASTIVALAEASRAHEKAGWFPARAAEYGEDVRSRMERGSAIRAADYLAARDELARAKAEIVKTLADMDAIVAPTTPIAASRIGVEQARVDKYEEPVRDALLRLNRPANFTGLPAISVPCGFTRNGLPVGLQIIGRAFDEPTILGIACCYERAHEWRCKHPGALD